MQLIIEEQKRKEKKYLNKCEIKMNVMNVQIKYAYKNTESISVLHSTKGFRTQQFIKATIMAVILANQLLNINELLFHSSRFHSLFGI